MKAKEYDIHQIQKTVKGALVLQTDQNLLKRYGLRKIDTKHAYFEKNNYVHTATRQ